MTTAIVKRELTPETWNMIKSIAPTMQQSRLFGVATVDQAAAVMLKGQELGLGLAAAFEFIDVIDGKPSLNPRGALALIHQSGQCEKVLIEDVKDAKGNPTACKVTMKRKGGIEYTATFTMDDANRAGLVRDKGGWTKYPANMLRWRAVGYAADVVFPDIIGGMKRADEFGAEITPDGDVIETQWSVQPQQPPAQITAQQNSGPSLADHINDMIAQYGAAKVYEAAGGKIPSTIPEAIAASVKLAQMALAEQEPINALDTLDAMQA